MVRALLTLAAVCGVIGTFFLALVFTGALIGHFWRPGAGLIFMVVAPLAAVWMVSRRTGKQNSG